MRQRLLMAVIDYTVCVLCAVCCSSHVLWTPVYAFRYEYKLGVPAGVTQTQGEGCSSLFLLHLPYVVLLGLI